jgi:hypothetical protein
MLATTMARVKYFFQALSPQPDIRHIAQLSPAGVKREPAGLAQNEPGQALAGSAGH